MTDMSATTRLDPVPEGPVLSFADVAKAYGRVVALTSVTFDVKRGHVHGLVGKNGVGKSTIVKILAGITRPDMGEVFVDGQPHRSGSPREMLRAGVRVVHQELSVLPDLTVWENVAGIFQMARGPVVRRKRTIGRVREILDQLEGGIDPQVRAGTLSLASQQIVEIARALYGGGRLLALDEPTSALTVSERERLAGLLRRFAAGGGTVLLVSHRLEEVLSVCDEVTVLFDGVSQGTFNTHGIAARQLAEKVTGGLSDGKRAASVDRPRGRSILSLAGVRSDRVGPIDLSVAEGEIVGLAGVEGSGTEDLLRLLAGVEGVLIEGAVRLKGRRMSLRAPAKAISEGVCYIPPDRRVALWLTRSIEDNIAAAALGQVSTAGIVRSAPKGRLATKWAERLDFPATRVADPVARFSGGNQQKVLLARVLASDPRLLLMEDPTRGIDVEARAEFHRLLVTLARDGVSVIWSSSDLAELLEISHRVVCMRRGHVVDVVDGAGTSETDLLTQVA